MSRVDQPLTILAVDDDPKSLEIIKVFLEAQGHVVYTASNGMDALQVIGDTPFDMVISDVRMPQMDGFELCRRIKENRETSLLPVVLVTALGRKEDRVRGIENGCDDFFTKPFDRLELQARISSLGRLKRYNEDLEHAEEVLKALAYSVEARDVTTGDHCQRLVEMGTLFANYLELDQKDIEGISKAGILHDIGKISVPDAVLLKPGPLNDEEWEIMKAHPVKGEALLKPLRTVQKVLPIVRHHHERWDGRGYPDGLAEEEIPFCARVMALIDVYDALRIKRPYKPALSHQEASKIIVGGAGQHFDPELVKAFTTVESGFAEIHDRRKRTKGGKN